MSARDSIQTGRIRFKTFITFFSAQKLRRTKTRINSL